MGRPFEFARSGGEPVLTSTAFVIALKKTLGYFFFRDGGSIRIGAKAQRLAAQSTMEAARLSELYGRRTRHVGEYNQEIGVYMTR